MSDSLGGTEGGREGGERREGRGEGREKGRCMCCSELTDYVYPCYIGI